MWFAQLCDTVALANRLRSRSVCDAGIFGPAGRSTAGGDSQVLKKDRLLWVFGLSWTVRAGHMAQSLGVRLSNPGRRVRLPGRILV
jgi:hypothetical protein